MGSTQTAVTTLTLLHALVAVGVLAVVVGLVAVSTLRARPTTATVARPAPSRSHRRTAVATAAH